MFRKDILCKSDKFSKKMLTNLIGEIERVTTDSYNLSKTNNISKLHDLLNQIFVFVGKCSSKKELNHITKLLISLFQKSTQEYFAMIDCYSKEMEEIQIEIIEYKKETQRNQNIEGILMISNRIMEVFLGIIRFSERLEAGLLSKDIIADKESIFFLNISNNIKKETALDICNNCKSFFERHRRLLFLNIEGVQKTSNISKDIIQDSLLYSFLLLASISSHSNHTYTMDINGDLIFYIINYIMNRNPEFDDYYLLEFSKRFEFEGFRLKGECLKEERQLSEKYNFFDGMFNRAMHILQIRSFNFNSFFLNQLIRLSKVKLTLEIIHLRKSHHFIAKIADFFISQIFKHNEMVKVFIETYKEENISVTTMILIEMFSVDREHAEIIFKELIISKKIVQFRCLFFERCRKLDSAYIDCLSIFGNPISFLSFDMIGKILKSHYLMFIVEEMRIFQQFIEILSDFYSFKCANEQNFDRELFFSDLIENLLIRRYKSKNISFLIYDNSFDLSQNTSSLTSLSSICSNDLKRNSLDATLEMMQKSTIFLDTFPFAIEHILPFLKTLLSRFDRKYETRANTRGLFPNNQSNTVEFISDDSFSQSNHILDNSTVTETFVMENTEVITKILNLTRPFILDWSLENLLRRLDPIFLMKNHVFPEKFQLDTLFFHSIQEILNMIEINSKQTRDSNTKNEHFFIQEIIQILLDELSSIFRSEDTFRTFIILKRCNLSRLLNFVELKSSSIEIIIGKSIQNESKDFYRETQMTTTLPSFSQSTNDPTILGYRPLEKKDFDSEDTEQSKTISDPSSISQKDNIIDSNTSLILNGRHMQLSDLDETFSVISLPTTNEPCKKANSYTNQHLLVDLMTEKMKLEFLKKGSNGSEDSNLIASCRSRLLLNYGFKPGLALYSSKISFEVKETQFSLYINFYQYQFTGPQFLVKFYLNTGFFGIKILNRHILMVFSNDNREKIVYQDSLLENKINSAFKFNSRLLSCSLNDEKLTFNTGKVEKIEIGDGFKGILDKILFYENDKFNNKYRKPTEIEEFYIRFIQPLEKRCGFYNHFGFFLFKNIPFFLSSKTRDIDIQNVFPIERYDFERIQN